MFILRTGEDVRSSRLRSLTALLVSGLVLTGVFTPSFESAAQAKPPRHSHTAPKVKTVRAATVRVSTAFLRSAPGEHKPSRALLDKGHSAKIVGEKGEWVRLRLASGTEGWVRADLLKVKEKTFRLPTPKKAKTVVAKAKPTKAAKSVKMAAKAKAKKVKTVVAKATPAINRATRFNRAAHAESARIALRAAHVEPKAAAVIAPEEAAPQTLPTRSVLAMNDTAREARHIDEDEQVPVAEEHSEPTNREQTIRSIVREVTSQNRTVASGNTRGQQRVRTALAYRGARYRSGATGRGGFDCSGFMVFLLSREGISLPRTAAEQFHSGARVERGGLRSGDLVFFKNTYKSGISHVGMYIGNNQFIHAANHRLGVKIDSLGSSYYANHWAGARRHAK